MALHGNYSVLHKSPARFMGGGAIAGARSAFNKHGLERNKGRVAGATSAEQLEANVASIPHGQGQGGAWVFPRTSGQRHGRASLSIGASGSGAKGRNMAGQSTLTVASSGTGGLIAGGVGTANIALSASGAVTATVGTPGAATIAMSGAAAPGAIGWMVGSASIAMSGTLVAYAKGHMVGTTEEQGLSVTGIANAVWNKIVESGFSAQEILRLLAAHAAGDANGLEGATTEFMSLDGSKPRITGSVAAGVRVVTDRDVT